MLLLHILKALVKVVLIDGESQMVTVEDGMSAQDLCFCLLIRFEKAAGPNWVIVEVLPSLHLGDSLSLLIKD